MLSFVSSGRSSTVMVLRFSEMYLLCFNGFFPLIDNDCVPRMKTDPMGHSDSEPTLKPINQVCFMFHEIP